MIRWLAFAVLAFGLVAYAFWIYLRVELSVAAARGLAVVRSLALVTLLFLLFDPRVPESGLGGAPRQWVLLDASLSMTGVGDGGQPWTAASERARVLEGDGWRVVHFGGLPPGAAPAAGAGSDGVGRTIALALAAAAEAGAREVRVLSDLRFDDRVALRSALESLPVTAIFERFDVRVANAGLARFEVPDVLQPESGPTAELEVFGGADGDSVAVEILEEDDVVATIRVAAPSGGLRATASVELPVPSVSGRVRYSARVAEVDAFPDDDMAVAYANVGHEEGALVLVSLRPDWEPRYLLPVLGEVTGLPIAGYLRAGPDRYVRLGPAVDRGSPADSATIRRAAVDAAMLVVHGLGEGADPWMVELLTRPGLRLLLPADAAGAASAGVTVTEPVGGEWYVSPDVPTSPIAGALSGLDLQGLPPLDDVMVATPRPAQPPLQLQLRGAGAPESGFLLLDRPEGRMGVALASGFWRWAMRETGTEPYRRIWSGLAGWLLADRRVASAEVRPSTWVFERAAPIRWSLPGDTVTKRIVVHSAEAVVVDTTVAGSESAVTGALAPGVYSYAAIAAAGDTLSRGRFDVSPVTLEMLPEPWEPRAPEARASAASAGEPRGLPLRTMPWPYLLVIVLLCGEWIVRRRIGLR